MRKRRYWSRQSVSVLVMLGFIVAVPPNTGNRVAARAPVQSEVTFEPLGRIFSGRAHALAVEGNRAYLLEATMPPLPRTQNPLGPEDVVVAQPELGRVVVLKYSYGGYGTTVLTDQLENPQGVVVERGGRSVVVTETSAGRITRITPGGGMVTKETVRSGLNMPYGVAIDDCNGDLIVTTLGDGRLLRLTAEGSQLTVLTEGLNGPKGVAIAQDGTLFVVESDPGTLVRLSADRSNIRRIAEGLRSPEMIALGFNGLIYVAEAGGGIVSEVHPQTGQRRVIISGLVNPSGVSPSIPPFYLVVTDSNKVRAVALQTGTPFMIVNNLGGTGCAVIPGTFQGSFSCYISAKCELVGNTLSVTGQVRLGGVGQCTGVELVGQLGADRSIIGPLLMTTDADGRYEFRFPELPPGSHGVARVTTKPCGMCPGPTACFGSRIQRCYF